MSRRWQTGRMQPPTAIPADGKDWTYVITDGCAECGFTPHDVTTTGARLRATLPVWRAALSRPDTRQRPRPTVWSPLEYACHVRDACQIFGRRLALMLDQDDPLFDNWDQDATALERDYPHADPATVAAELAAELEATAAAFDEVRPRQWQRPGRRGNGSVFTVASFAVYFLHDVDHHVHDVTR